MKNILFGSAVVAALIFSGCGSSSSSDDNTTTPEGNTTTPESNTTTDDIAPSNESVVSVNGTDWTVVKVNDIDDNVSTDDVNETFISTKTWEDAKKYCEDIVDPDSTWALPTLEQAKTLVTDLNDSDPDNITFSSYNTEVIPGQGVSGPFIWLQDEADPDAWILYMGGSKFMKYGKTNPGHVTCVKQ